MSEDAKQAVINFLMKTSGGRATRKKIQKGVGRPVNFAALVQAGVIRQATDAGGETLQNCYELVRQPAGAGD